METVTLLRNPRGGHRGGRRRRNPGLVSAIQRPLPDMTEIVAGLGGAGLALQLPHMLKATRWMNVVWSAVITVGGAFALHQMKMGRSAVNAFALGGTVITAAKAIHIATTGRVGLSPGTTALAPPMTTAAAAAPAGAGRMLADISGRNGVERWKVGAFRDSQVEGDPESFKATALT